MRGPPPSAHFAEPLGCVEFDPVLVEDEPGVVELEPALLDEEPVCGIVDELPLVSELPMLPLCEPLDLLLELLALPLSWLQADSDRAARPAAAMARVVKRFITSPFGSLPAVVAVVGAC
jgi:hypothetical protein